jgi:hypothetical protein
VPDSGPQTPGAMERDAERPFRPGYEARIRAAELWLMSEIEQHSRVMRRHLIDYTWLSEAAAGSADEHGAAYRENVRRMLETTAAFLELDRPAESLLPLAGEYVATGGRLWTHKVDPSTFA